MTLWTLWFFLSMMLLADMFKLTNPFLFIRHKILIIFPDYGHYGSSHQ